MIIIDDKEYDPAEMTAEQQHLVAAVDAAVDAFGQHRRRAGDARGDELGDADPEIGGKRPVQHDILADPRGQPVCHCRSLLRRRCGIVTRRMSRWIGSRRSGITAV